MTCSMDLLEIPIQILDEGLATPGYAYPGDAGVDLRTTVDFALAPFERMAVPTGIAVELPDGYAALVLPRSGLAAKHGISLVNSPGLIDSNYRGEIKAILVNLDPVETFQAKRGDRIAQLVITRVESCVFAPRASLAESNRGASGFGSSGTM